MSRHGFAAGGREVKVVQLLLVCLLVLPGSALATAGRGPAPRAGNAPAALTATLLPASGGQGKAQLAVAWRGEPGLQIDVVSYRAGRAETLVSNHVLNGGMNLLSIRTGGAEGALRLEVHRASGQEVASKLESLAALRGSSQFAWSRRPSTPVERASWPQKMASGLRGMLPGSLVGGLVAGGFFTQAGNVTANNIAHWDGSTWSTFTGPSDTGTDGIVDVVAVYNGELVAGGNFDTAGGVEVLGIAHWDGTRWQPFVGSSGIPGVMENPFDFVHSLAVFRGDLYVGGMFAFAGGRLVNNIARWNGTDWSAVSGPSGTGVNTAPVWGLVEYNGTLVAAGSFTAAGGVPASHVASWDGTAWSALGSGLGDPNQGETVFALTIYNGDLYAGGFFVDSGRAAVNNIARWNAAGGAWAPLLASDGSIGTSSPGSNDAEVRALTVYNGQLIAGGFFTQAGNVTANHVAAWNGPASTWSALAGPSGNGTDNPVLALTQFAGTVIVGGEFSHAGGLVANNIASWNGTTWSPLIAPDGTNGVDDNVLTLLSI